ncbi:nucleotidyltransferase [Variovorax sp. J22R133]|uniref:nucleotidyltransferase n=1 Tax=Variovorax brevis TaxID=3053503 RepID=UPI00257756DA|nr:nucleotidyltransferase [Variovorax sp. J22R133]MDM0110571.1 nucleotidyltransferase [Variovorax sp. J22R133]
MADQYLADLLQKYQVNTAYTQAVAEQQIYAPIAQWAGPFLAAVTYSGSLAKGTANSCSTDMDLFISLTPRTPESLQGIYGKLFQAAQAWGWNPRPQNVSIGITVKGLSIDLVPGRQQEGYQNWHSLYHRRGNTWRQTNVQLHIQAVSQSGRVNEIRLMKLWRDLAGLEFPSFYLELCIMEALRGCRVGRLAENFSLALEWLRDELSSHRVMDPANSANCISDDLTLAEKQLISRSAAFARSQPSYSNFVW